MLETKKQSENQYPSTSFTEVYITTPSSLKKIKSKQFFNSYFFNSLILIISKSEFHFMYFFFEGMHTVHTVES